MKTLNPLIKHIVSFVLVCLMGGIVFLSAGCFEIEHRSVIRFILYFGTLLGFPICILLLTLKRKPFNFYMLGMTVLTLVWTIWVYCTSTVMVYTGVENYLVGDSSFESAAKLVLPDRSELNEHSRYRYTESSLDFSVIELTVVYSENEYEMNLQKVQEQFAQHSDELSDFLSRDSEGLVLNDHYYEAFWFIMDNEYYAVAYNGCAETNTIRYVFFSCSELGWMSVAGALSCNEYPGVVYQ